MLGLVVVNKWLGLDEHFEKNLAMGYHQWLMGPCYRLVYCYKWENQLWVIINGLNMVNNGY